VHILIYEWRVYDIHPGKLPDIHRRFKEHTLDLFAQHGIEVVLFLEKTADDGYDQLQYLCCFTDKATRDKAFAEFGADPEWKQVKAASEVEGPIVRKVTSTFLQPVDYFPAQ
jgi:hypothetical protein